MGFDIFVSLLFGTVLTYLAWDDRKMGRIPIGPFVLITRDKRPRLFQIIWMSRAATAALCFVGAAALALGWLPINSN
jgi:hypothetical protein